jgi:hypothetical protein
MKQILLACILVITTACAEAQPKTVLPEKWQDKATAAKWLSEHAGSAVFVSRGGRMYGMDSDAVVAFPKNGGVEVTEFGVAPATYRGTYVVDDADQIRLTLEGYKAEWPLMHLYTSERDAWLMRCDKKAGFDMGDRGGATETGTMASYWPFRLKKKER